MQQRYNQVVNNTGFSLVPIQGVTVTVLNYPLMTVATLFSDDGVTPLANPVTTGGEGEYAYYAADGKYVETFAFAGQDITPDPNPVFILFDSVAPGVLVYVESFDQNDGDQAMLQRALDFCATVVDTQVWDSTDNGPPTGPVVTLAGGNREYNITAPLALTVAHRNLRIFGLSLVATGGGWSTGDYMFAPASGAATRIEYDGVRLNCNNKCSGVDLRSFSTARNCWIVKVAGVGVLLNGAAAKADSCVIWQWEPNDNEYFLQANYTGVGIQTADTDGVIIDCNVLWLYECVRIEHLNTEVSGGHFVNSMADFSLGGRTTFAVKGGGNTGTGTFALSTSGPVLNGASVGVYTLRCTATAANNGTFQLRDPANVLVSTIVMAAGVGAVYKQIAGTITDGGVDFIVGDGWDITVTNIGRTYAPNLIVQPGDSSNPRVAVRGVYFDNGTIELYSNRVNIENCDFATKQNASTFDTWIRCYALTASQAFQVQIINPNIFLNRPEVTKFIDFLTDGGTWNRDWTDFIASSMNDWGLSDEGISFVKHQTLIGNGENREVQKVFNPRETSRTMYADNNTSDLNSGPYVGSLGDVLLLAGISGIKALGLPTYADDAAAGAGGLTTGFLYQTASGAMRIKL